MTTRTIAVTCAITLAGSVALADWTVPSVGSISGTPTDLVCSGAGNASLTTTSGAYEIKMGTTVGLTISVPSLASSWISPGCLNAIDSGGQLARNCGTTTSYSTTLPATIRARVTSTSRGWACSRDMSMMNSVYTKDMWGFANDWTVAGAWSKLSGTQLPGKCTGPIAALSLGTEEYALFAFQDTTTPGAANNLSLLRNGAILFNAGTLGTGNVAPDDVELAGYAGGPLRAFVIEASTGELKISEVDGGFGAFTSVAPPPGVAKFRSVSVFQSGTERFGMAVGELLDGGTTVLSAVPDPDPRAFGMEWRTSTNPPAGLSGALRLVDCSGANACAVASSGTGLASVATYVNANAPANVMGPPVSVPEGSSVTASASATDPDGDAVYIAWTPPGPGFAVQATNAGESAMISAPMLGGICDAGVPVQFTLTATDGMAGHATTGTVQVTVTRNSPPLTPGVQGSPLLLRAGGPTGSAQAVRNANECIDFPYAWSTASAYGIQVAGSADGKVTVTPPAHLCVPGGVTESFDVVATSPYGNSDAGVLTVHVDPWGPPEPPFAAGARATQEAGTTVAYGPAATHVCDDGGTKVPLTTRWTLDGGTLPGAVSVQPDLEQQGSAVAPELVVASADRCTSGAVQVFARNEITTTGEASPWSPLQVTITPDWDPIEQAKLQLTLNGTSLSGDLDVSGINCVADRGLQAEVYLESEGVQVLKSDAGVPGPWQLPVPATCTERQFTVHAELPGLPSSRSNDVTWTSPAGDPALGTLDGGVLRAECVDVGNDEARVVATGTLHHEPSAASCSEQQVEWTETSGPALTETTVTGNDAVARAQAVAWDQVIDRDLAIEVVARAGAKRSAPATVIAHIAPAAPFVSARIDANPPIASESGIVGLVARLHNDSGCPIQNARWMFFLEGLESQSAVARVSGEVKSVVTAADSSVAIDGISIEPYGETVVTFTARPALLGRPTARGVLVMGDESPEPISNEARLGEGVETGGCGCGATDASAFGLALLVVALLGARGRTVKCPRN